MGLLSKAASISAPGSSPDAAAEVLDFMTVYHREHPEDAGFQGIVLDLPPEADTRAGFFEQAARMTAPFAAARCLPSGRCLLLFSPSLDRELIGHRAAKTLNTTISLTFAADTVENACTLLRPYL